MSPLAPQLRTYLRLVAQTGKPVTYQTVARALDLSPPNTIHQVAVVLEDLIAEDAAAARPLISTLVISKARGGLPAPGFFICAGQAGCFTGAPEGPDAIAFYTAELDRAVTYWSTL